MSEKKEITAEDLNKAMQEVAKKALRENKALGLDTLYQKGNYIIRVDAEGNEHKVKKLKRRKKKKSTANVVTFNK